MDTSIAAGTRSSAQAIAFAQKRAMPKQILPAKVEAPVKMPETSVQQLRQRADAEIAAQHLHAPKDSIQKDLLADREGALVARRRAAREADHQATGGGSLRRSLDGVHGRPATHSQQCLWR